MKITLLFCMAFFLFNVCYAQIDTTQTGIGSAYQWNSKKYPILEKTVDYFAGEVGVKVIKEHGILYKILVDSEGIMLSKGEIEIYITHDTGIVIGDSAEWPDISRTTVKHVFRTWYHGQYRDFYGSGKVKAHGNYKLDLKDGIWKYYDPDGKLIRREKWKMGVLEK